METRDLDRIRFVTRHFNDLQGLRYCVPLGLITLSMGGTTYFSNRPWVILRACLFLGAVLLAFGARRYYRRSFGEVERLPAEELQSLTIFSPAGPAPRLQGAQLMTPAARHLSVTLGLAFALFFVFQAITPTIMINVDESLAQPPWATLDNVFLAHEPWTQGVESLIRPPMISPSTAKAVLGQMAFALYGAFFLGLWLWRGRRPSQGYHLALGIALLALSVFGTCLGYLVWEDRDAARFVIDHFLPALVHPWVALLLCGSLTILVGLFDHWQLVRALRRPVLEEES